LQQPHAATGVLSNIHPGASSIKRAALQEQAAGVTNQFYNSRITEGEATGQPAQKLRIN